MIVKTLQRASVAAVRRYDLAGEACSCGIPANEVSYFGRTARNMQRHTAKIGEGGFDHDSRTSSCQCVVVLAHTAGFRYERDIYEDTDGAAV